MVWVDVLMIDTLFLSIFVTIPDTPKTGGGFSSLSTPIKSPPLSVHHTQKVSKAIKENQSGFSVTFCPIQIRPVFYPIGMRIDLVVSSQEIDLKFLAYLIFFKGFFIQ